MERKHTNGHGGCSCTKDSGKGGSSHSETKKPSDNNGQKGK